MNVTKVINNNIVISENEEKQELVVMGKGLGFKKKPGDAIDDTKIEKVYLSTQEWNVTKLTQLLSSIPIEHIQAANEIISFAKVSLGKKLSEKLFPDADRSYQLCYRALSKRHGNQKCLAMGN